MKNTLKLINGKNLKSPKGLSARPTTSKVREALRNILREQVIGSNWLDLCSGSGSIGCEALEMGARRVLSIELNRENAKICKENLISTAEVVKHEVHLEVICNEVINTLKNTCKNKSKNFSKLFPKYDYRFDFIYLDPPYQSGIYSIVLEYLLRGNWVKDKAIVICECSKRYIPKISSTWLKVQERAYGNICLIFLTPNPALHYHDDIDSKPPQKAQE